MRACVRVGHVTQMETVEPQGVSTVEDEGLVSAKPVGKKVNVLEKDRYKKRDEMKKNMTANIGDNFVIRTMGTPSEKKAMESLYQEIFKKVAGDIKEQDKVAIIVINKNLEAEIHVTPSLCDTHLPQERIVFEEEKHKEFEKKVKELLQAENMKVKHLDTSNEYIVEVIFQGNTVPTRLQKKILDYMESDVSQMGGKGPNPFDLKTEKAILVKEKSENGCCMTSYTTSRKVMLRQIAACLTSIRTNKGMQVFRKEMKEMLVSSVYDIFINVVSQEGVPASKEEICEAVTDAIPDVKFQWPGLSPVTGNVNKMKAKVIYPSDKNLDACTKIVISRNGSRHISRGVTVIQVVEAVAWQLQENMEQQMSDQPSLCVKSMDVEVQEIPDVMTLPTQVIGLKSEEAMQPRGRGTTSAHRGMRSPPRAKIMKATSSSPPRERTEAMVMTAMEELKQEKKEELSKKIPKLIGSRYQSSIGAIYTFDDGSTIVGTRLPSGEIVSSIREGVG